MPENGGADFFGDTGTNSRSIHHTSIHNANKFQLKYTLYIEFAANFEYKSLSIN